MIADILLALCVIGPSVLALWFWRQLGEREEEASRLEAEVQRLVQSRQHDMERIAALRRQLSAAGAPTTVRPRPPLPEAFRPPLKKVVPLKSVRELVTARSAMEEPTRSDDFVNTALLMSMFPTPAPAEPPAFESGKGGDFGGGGASGTWSDSSSGSSTDTSSTSGSGASGD